MSHCSCFYLLIFNVISLFALVAHTSLSYEKVCVLFNIAALQSTIAAQQSMDSDEGLKMAIKLLQQAAGILQYLKGAVPAAIPSEPTPDLSQDALAILTNLMLAQAQEVFITKAIKDNMKDAIIAKLCCHCEDIYAELLRLMQKEDVRNFWDKDWITIVAGKQAGFHGLTQLYQSYVCRAGKKVGEEIARLQDAVELFKAAQTRSGNAALFNEFDVKAKRNLVESKKDNDFIYNEIIPDVKSLGPPGKAPIAKATPITSPLSSSFKDLFADLVPVVLHQALAASDLRKNEIVNTEILKLREATQTLNGILSSLNLPACVETADSGCGLPPSLLEKASDVRQKGGSESINNFMKEMPELLTRNREILDETERMMNEERDSDNQLRAQFKEKWTRNPSDKLTEMFRSNAQKYRKVINDAIEADKIVRQKFEKNARGIQLLSMTPEEIQSSIPSTGGNSDACNSSAAKRLRVLMESVETIKAERDAIESELKTATFNMKDQFISALSQDGAINEPAISLAEIGKVLSPLQAQVQDSIKRQQTLVTDVQQTHSAFVAETGSQGNSRDTLLQELASAYDNFIELQSNLKEGTKFYNDLTNLLVVFQNKISDYCFARKTEKEELLKDLTTESSRQAAATLPSVPAHYASTSGGSSVTGNGFLFVSYKIEVIHCSFADFSGTAPSAAPSNIPYPTAMQGMPLPYGATVAAPYPTYIAPPMPQGFNPYATLPYPSGKLNLFILV